MTGNQSTKKKSGIGDETKQLTVYIASSWKNEHGVTMLTHILREKGFHVISWIENNYGEHHNHVTKEFDFETWVNGPASEQSFEFDTYGAMNCDLFIYYGHGGKDAAAECGMAFGSKKCKAMVALDNKNEDFGLMRKMFSVWFGKIDDLIFYCQVFKNTYNVKS